MPARTNDAKENQMRMETWDGEDKHNVPRSALNFACALDVSVETFADDDEDKPRRFKMNGHTGARMNRGFFGDLVINLEGITFAKSKKLAILRDHDPGKIVGFGKASRSDAGHIQVDGTFSRSTPDGIEAEGLAGEKFPWQASIGIDNVKAEFIEEGTSALVNGRTEKGPVTIVRKSRLREVSFVALGADANTSAIAAADAPTEEIQYINQKPTEDAMSEEKLDAAKKEAVDAERGRFKALVDAFGTELGAKAYGEGWTVEETKIQQYSVLTDENKKLTDEVARLNAKPKDEPKPEGRAPIAKGAAPEATGPQTFAAAVEAVTKEQKVAGEFKSKGEAMKVARERFSALYASLLDGKE